MIRQMKQPRDDLRPSTGEWLRDALRGNGAAVALALAILALFIGMGWWFTRQAALPEEREDGVIVRFGGHEMDDGSYLVVVVRIGNGQLEEIPASFGALTNCRAGGKIRLVRQGAILRVASRACAARPAHFGGRTS